MDPSRLCGRARARERIRLQRRRAGGRFNQPPPQAALAKADWLAVFPTWLADPPTTALVEERFVLRESVRIPPEEYTICPCPGQNATFIYQSRADPRGREGPASVRPG